VPSVKGLSACSALHTPPPYTHTRTHAHTHTSCSWVLPGAAAQDAACRLVLKYLEAAGEELAALCTSKNNNSGSNSTGTGTAAGAGDCATKDAALQFRTRCRGLLASMAAVAIGLMSHLRDFDAFDEVDNACTSAPRVIGAALPPLGARGVRDRAARALCCALRRLASAEERELAEQACYTCLLLMCPGMLEQALGGQGRQGGKDDGAIIDEPAAATEFLLARAGATAGGDCGDGGDFLAAFQAAEAAAHQLDMAAGSDAAGSNLAAQQQQQPQQLPGPGSWGSDWRWRRRSSALGVLDRLRRMLLWRCAQASGKAGPVGCAPNTPVPLSMLPAAYVELFAQLLRLSMAPNAGVRASAMPTLHACVKRFPCLIEVLLPEGLAALAGIPGPFLHHHTHLANEPAALQQQQQPLLETDAQASLQEEGEGAGDAAGAGSTGGLQQQLAMFDAASFYASTLRDAMCSAAADEVGGAGSASLASSGSATAVSAGEGGNSNSGGTAAAESVNDGRVAGACALLAGCLDAWRCIFREDQPFVGFMHSLLAARRHSSAACLKSTQVLIMQVCVCSALLCSALLCSALLCSALLSAPDTVGPLSDSHGSFLP
jgi:hypothetical protein